MNNWREFVEFMFPIMVVIFLFGISRSLDRVLERLSSMSTQIAQEGEKVERVITQVAAINQNTRTRGY